MVGIFDSISFAVNAYKDKLGQGLVYSILMVLIEALAIIPIVGPIITALLYPSIVRKIADEWGLSVGEMDSSEVRKAAFIVIALPGILFHIAFLGIIIKLLSSLAYGSLDATLLTGELFKYILDFAIVLIISFVISLLFLYSLYALILGKEKTLRINIKNSILLIALVIILSIIFGIIINILKYIPIVGVLAIYFLQYLAFPSVLVLAILHYTRSL